MTNLFLTEMFVKAKEMLNEAEKLYGARDTSWEFTGVILQEDGPNIWFPSKCSNNKEIQIALSPQTVNNPDLALYQLAHEVVHLLAPSRQPPTIMLEEGVAVYFSINQPDFIEKEYKQNLINRLTTGAAPENYKNAYNLYAELLAHNHNAIMVLRNETPEFYNMTPDFIISELNVDEEFAKQLCDRREMR